MLSKLANVIARSLSIIFERSWLLREDAKDCKKASVTPACRKGKEDLGNYRLVGLTSNPGKVMEQIFLQTISKHIKDKKVIGQH